MDLTYKENGKDMTKIINQRKIIISIRIYNHKLRNMIRFYWEKLEN